MPVASVSLLRPTVGEPAPEAALTDTEGQPVQLSEFWAAQPLVVVFLRHLGCVFCREQIAILKRNHASLRSAGAQVACVAQGDSKTGKAFSLLFDLPFPVLMCGDNLSAYHSYGLVPGNFWQLFGPAAIIGGIRAVFGGATQGKIVGDGSQMPGTFIIDTRGIVRYTHRNKDVADHADSQELLQAVQTVVK